MKIKIKKDSKHSPFTGDDGSKIDYFWTKATVLESEFTNLVNCVIEFGGKVAHKAGEELDAEIEKQASGKFKEIPQD